MGITKWEARLIGWAQKHLSLFILALVSLAGVGLRVSLRDILSPDAQFFLLPWYDQMQAAGGLPALGVQIGNYNLAYQTLIALLTYLPLEPLYAYKLLSSIFDYGLAVAVAAVVWKLLPRRQVEGALMAYSLVVLSPLVWLNSAAWAQCDAIYVFFLVASLACFLWQRYNLTFILLGLGIAFKLQAVFALPFFLVAWFGKKRFSLVNFLWIPGILLLTGLPAILMGRDPRDMISIYFGQMDEYSLLFLKYPSFWALVDGKCQISLYPVLKTAAIYLTLGVLLLWAWLWLRKFPKPEGIHWLYLFFILSYSCVLFLPAMHERYGFLYEIAAIAIAMIDKKTWPLLAALTVISLPGYCLFLFGWQALSIPVLTVANCAVYLLYGRHILCQRSPKLQEVGVASMEMLAP